MYVQAIAEVKAGEVSSVQTMVQQKRKTIRQERLMGNMIGIRECGIEKDIVPRRSKQLITTR
jgi:mRNA-degrading endonuclease YafQ of YafQ-DinJ toxin-antitoxin module